MDTPRAAEIAVDTDGEFLDVLLDLVRDGFVYDFPVCCVLLELDGFEDFVTEHGLLAGELILAQLTPLLRRSFRASDLVQRLAGNRYLVVLGGAPAEVCPRIAANLSLKVERHIFQSPSLVEAERKFTLSVGLATSGDSNLPAIELPESAATDARQPGRHCAWDITSNILDNAHQALSAASEAGNELQLSRHYPVQTAPTEVA